MDKVIFDTLNLGPHMPRLVAEKSIADFVASKMISMYLADQKPKWASMGIPQSAQDFIESLLRSVVVGSLAGGVSLVLKFCRFSEKPTPDDAQRSSAALQALYEENQGFTSKARTLDILARAARSDSRPPSATEVSEPKQDEVGDQRRNKVTIKPCDLGQAPFHGLTHGFIEQLASDGLMKLDEAQAFESFFHSAMLTAAANVFELTSKSAHDANARQVLRDMVGECGAVVARAGQIDPERAARNVH